MKIAALKLFFKIIKISQSIHQRNLQILMAEVYKIIKGEAPAIMTNLSIFRENIHNIRNFSIIADKNKNTVRYGLKIICYKTPYLWASPPGEYKHQDSVGKFKEKIKNWKFDSWNVVFISMFG